MDLILTRICEIEKSCYALPALAAHLREQTKTLEVNQKNQGQNGDFSVRFKMQ